MGQKVSPHGLRVGVISDWDSKWYAGKKNFADYLIEDNKVREFIKKRLYAAGISKTVIERTANNQIQVSIMTDKPGIIIGSSGSGTDEVKAALEKLTGKTIRLNVVEVKRSELDAQLSAESIAQALEKRVSFRRAMKQAIGRTMRAGAKGVKVVVAGRLGGAEIARSEKYSEGNVPLHTLRANIVYGFAEADTTYGRIGVKVWINLGEKLDKGLISQIPKERSDGKRERRGGRRDNDRSRRDGRRDGGRGRGPRDEKPVFAKTANPRKRLTPKTDPNAEALKKAENEAKIAEQDSQAGQVAGEGEAAVAPEAATPQAEE
jgi:small subunit ribosomal protein S3